MIERGLIAWLVTDYLARSEVKVYGLEYSTALLMNLCLHRSGKEQCVPIATTVLEILVKLLITDIKQVSVPRCIWQFLTLVPLYNRSIPMSTEPCTAY